MDDERLESARVAMLFTLGKPAYYTTVALGGILLAALWLPYAPHLLLGWFLALVAVSIGRIALHWRFLRERDKYSPRQWENRFALGALASGAVWAFAAFVFFPAGDPILQTAVILIIGGAMVGAVGLFAPSIRAVYGFCALPLLAVVAQLLRQPLLTYQLLALSVAVFGVVMARMAQVMRRNVGEILGGNVRNEALLARANASETQLRDAIQSFPEGLAIWDTDDRLVVCNEMYARLYGAGKSTTWEAERRGEVHQYQSRDGRWLQGSTMPMHGGGWVGLVSDITALQHAQEAYLKVLAEEHLVLDTLPVGVAFVEKRVIVRCNRRLEQMLGYAAGQLTGKSTRILYASEEAWTTAGQAYSRITDSAILESDVELRKMDGGNVWCRLLSRPLDSRQPSGSAIVAFSDIAERHVAEGALKRSEQMYRNLVETSSELIWSLDREARWTYLNAAGARRIYGREAAEMIGRPFSDAVARELRERDHAVVQRMLAGEAVFNHETRHVCSDGGYVDLSFNAIALRDAAGRIVGATGTARNVTEEKRARAALHESVAKLRLAVDAADLYYWEWDADSDSLHWGRDPGMLPPAPEGVARKWRDYAELVFPDDRERYLATARAAAERLEPFELEYRVVARDGGILWFSARGAPVLDSGGKLSRMMGVSQDITERKRREEAVRFLAYHDSLTGLPNRRLLDDRLKQAVNQAQRRHKKVAAMLVELDSFKQVNDSAGHRAGDNVLREVAQRLAGCVRKADTLARHGGDEFVIIMSDVQAEADCQIVADKVLHVLAEPFLVDGASFTLGASIGVSLFPSDAGDGDTLLRNADAAMYQAKQMGRNRFRFYGR